MRPRDSKFVGVLKSQDEENQRKIFGSRRLPWGISESGREGNLTLADREKVHIKQRVE